MVRVAGKLPNRLFGMLVVLVLFGCSAVSDQTRRFVGQPTPETRFFISEKGSEGDYVGLSSFRGKRVVLGFWDTQCPYSRKMVLRLNELAESYTKRRDLVFIAVSIDPEEARETWAEVIQSPEFNYIKHAFSGNGPLDEAFMMFRLDAIPVVVVIGQDGKVEAVSDSASVVEEVLSKK